MSSTGFTSPFGLNANPFGSNMETGMCKVIEEDEEDSFASPTTSHFVSKSGGWPQAGHGVDGTSDEATGMLRRPPMTDSYPVQYNLNRRTSVSAESLNPSANNHESWTPPVHPKTNEQIDRLKKAINGNFLFTHLDDEQTLQVLGALLEKPIPAKDIKVISQGDAGDYFYVVEKGTFDVYVNSTGILQAGEDGMGRKVGNIGAGGSFGELALMYNAPRAATVISAESNCTLWALDRLTFRRILMESTFARRRMYESFLEEVPILQTLTPYERSKIADALDSLKYPACHMIIKEGDPGHSFYLLEAGEAEAFKNGNPSPVKQYKKGDFFGELALLNDQPRAASVISKTEVKVAALGKDAFQRLLGPVEKIMRRTSYEDVKSGVEEMDPLQTS